MEVIIAIVAGIMTLLGTFLLGRISKHADKQASQLTPYDHLRDAIKADAQAATDKATKQTQESTENIRRKTNEEIIYSFNDAFTDGPITGPTTGSGGDGPISKSTK